MNHRKLSSFPKDSCECLKKEAILSKEINIDLGAHDVLFPFASSLNGRLNSD